MIPLKAIQRWWVLICACLALLGPFASAQSFTISTVAGNSTAGFSGDGGPATGAALRNPAGVAVGSDLCIYIADLKNRRVRKVEPDGTIKTIAGTDESFNAKSSGDGGPATSANFGSPYGIAIDRTGYVYVGDQQGQCVRRIAPDGVITRFAGNGLRGYAGDGGLAIDARLSGPNDIDFDAQRNVYIADTGNHRIRIVDSDGKITTFAGIGTAGYSGDGGPADQAQLNAPAAICFDASGQLYICNFGNHCVRKVSKDRSISTIAGTGKKGFSGDGGPAANAELFQPCGVAVDKRSRVYIADSANCRIRIIREDGTIHTVAGTGRKAYRSNGGPAAAAEVSIPDLIDSDATGAIYIAAFQNHIIRKLTPDP